MKDLFTSKGLGKSRFILLLIAASVIFSTIFQCINFNGFLSSMPDIIAWTAFFLLFLFLFFDSVPVQVPKVISIVALFFVLLLVIESIWSGVKNRSPHVLYSIIFLMGVIYYLISYITSRSASPAGANGIRTTLQAALVCFVVSIFWQFFYMIFRGAMGGSAFLIIIMINWLLFKVLMVSLISIQLFVQSHLKKSG